MYCPQQTLQFNADLRASGVVPRLLRDPVYLLLGQALDAAKARIADLERRQADSNRGFEAHEFRAESDDSDSSDGSDEFV